MGFRNSLYLQGCSEKILNFFSKGFSLDGQFFKLGSSMFLKTEKFVPNLRDNTLNELL